MKGRKRHLLVDAGGLVLLAHVHAADPHDRVGARALISRAAPSDPPRVEPVWADGAYDGSFARWLEAERGWRVEVPRHRDRQLWRYGLEEKPRGFEFAALDRVDRFNTQRPLEPIGDVPPAEAEGRYYAQAEEPAPAAWLTPNGLRQPRRGSE